MPVQISTSRKLRVALWALERPGSVVHSTDVQFQIANLREPGFTLGATERLDTLVGTTIDGHAQSFSCDKSCAALTSSIFFLRHPLAALA